MAHSDEPALPIVTAALAAAAQQGWRRLSLDDIAAAAGVSLAELYRHFHSKTAILAGLFAAIDRAVLADLAAEAGAPAGSDGAIPAPAGGEAGPGGSVTESVRDRLFDVLMRRFDALTPYRDGLRVVAREWRPDPLAGLQLACGFDRSMAWMLAAAGVDDEGWRGRLRRQALGALYLSVFSVWLNDDSADLSRTMAALDARLRRAEAFSGTLRRQARPAAAEPASARPNSH